jgi:putative membrane protein
MTQAETSTELSGRRTGMSFQRTRMSADRTLMSVIRTAISLIGFGFTIFQFFQKLEQANVLKGNVHGPRNLGVTLVLVGIGMLVVGIVYHLQFMLSLRRLRAEMQAEGLIHGETPFPPSLTLIIALVLLTVGIVTIVTMIT